MLKYALGPHKRIASLFLLPQCEMSCRFCASELDFSAMSFAQAADLLAALRDRGIVNVVLGGGEPFLWPHDLVALTAVAHGLGLEVQVCTNGLHLPPGFEAIPTIDRYILPLESMDPAVHDRLRVYRESHLPVVLGRLETLRGAGRGVTLSTVVTSENLAELGAIADHLAAETAAGLRVHAWHLYRFLPVGRGGLSHGRELAVPREAYRAACAAMKARGLGFPVYRRDDMLNPSTVAFFWYEGETLKMGAER